VDPAKAIRSALGFCQGDAALWALPYLKDLGNGTVPFNGRWAEFAEAFRTHFLVQDIAATARAVIKALVYKKEHARKFVLVFKDQEAKLGYDEVALPDWFRKKLPETVKDRLTLYLLRFLIILWTLLASSAR
jgi:hypothetical protein